MKKFKIILFLTVIFLFFLRIDYRFQNEITCCSDDYSYWSHAETIALDFDFNYKNQPPGSGNLRFEKNNKIVPIGFVGSGILLSPFMYIGKVLSNNLQDLNQLMNFKIFIYSLGNVVYFFSAYFLIQKSLLLIGQRVNNYFLLLTYFGSGLVYFAFERYSMTHVPEVFINSLIIYISLKFYTEQNTSQIYTIMLPILLGLGLLIRMSNYYILLIPLLISLKYRNYNKTLLKNKFFLLSAILTFAVYVYILINLYGEFIVDPREIYNSNLKILNSKTELSIFSFILSYLKTVLIVYFSFEFGLLWVSPILFISIYVFFNFILKKNFADAIFLIIFAQNLFIVHIWQSTASSYGFRYIYSLIPLCYVFALPLITKNKITNYYLIYFSIFSCLATMFFETTQNVQLSNDLIQNSFGKMTRYSQPKFVIGVFESIVNFESYLIIFTTSFVGVIIFKLLFFILGKDDVYMILKSINLPVENNDFIEYTNNVSLIGSEKLIIILLLLIYYARKMVKN